MGILENILLCAFQLLENTLIGVAILLLIACMFILIIGVIYVVGNIIQNIYKEVKS